MFGCRDWRRGREAQREKAYSPHSAEDLWECQLERQTTAARRGYAASPSTPPNSKESQDEPASFWSSGDQCDVSRNASYGSEAEYVSEMVKQSFERKPKETAAAILESISELDRIHLLLAMQSTASKANVEVRDREYIDEIIKSIKSEDQGQQLSRGEIANALAYQRMLQRYNSHAQHPPTWRQLTRVMLAAGLPFVGFGFTDNAVMLLAGEAIDHYGAVQMGITTMAAAGLGNIAADVVGVSVTHQIKEKSRKIRWAQPPRLSTLQQAMKSVRSAKMAGAVLGVTVGCLVGMAPLALPGMEGFFKKDGWPHSNESDE
jgi:hypothetical protein